MSNAETVICQAMKDAGILDPETQSGIDFCLKCPYPYCIVVEAGGSGHSGKTDESRIIVRRMAESGMKPREIANVLGKSIRTIQRYLRGRNSKR